MHVEQRIKERLKGIGLSDAETAVYMALLSLGPQPASVAAKKSGLKRAHTYNVLEDLIRSGIVQEFTKSGIKYFTCLPPQVLVTILEQREQELDARKKKLLEVLPDLEHIRNPAILQPKVRFFSGIDGIKQIYEDTIREPKKDLLAIGDFDHFFPREHSRDLNDWMWDYCQRRAKRGVTYKGIVNKSETTDLAFKRRKGERRVFKMLTNTDMTVEINIYGNKVAIISSSRDMVGLLIEDKPIADTLRNFHAAMWKKLPDYR
ncbi:MAG: helix-turn-helix domain-containing protein [Patescibacteria group bacterium]